MHPILFHHGSFTLYSFSVAMLAAALAAGTVAGARLAASGIGRSDRITLLIAATGGGLAGARLWWIAESVGRAFLSAPGLGGGLVWYGGLVGGTVAVTVVAHRRRLAWLMVADALAPAVALALAVGRIGCHLAGDGDWGTATSLPWGVSYERGVMGWPHPPGTRVHPAALYECLASVAIFACTAARRRPRGQATFRYALLAGAARLVVEVVRTNPVVLWHLTEAQLSSLALMASGSAGLARAHGRARRGGRGPHEPGAISVP